MPPSIRRSHASLAALAALIATAPGIHAQPIGYTALDSIRAMGFDSVAGRATAYFRPGDRARALELQAMLDDFLAYWNPRLGVDARLRIVALNRDDWSRLTPLPYGFPNNSGPIAELIAAPVAHPPAQGPDTLLVEEGRDHRDWLVVGHEGGHLLTWALLPATMRDMLGAHPNDVSPDVQRRFRAVQSIPGWYYEYAASAFATGFADAIDPGTAAVWRSYVRGLMRIPEPRFVQLDDWFGRLMRESAPDGTPAYATEEGGPNFGWYQAAVAMLGDHVFGRNQSAAIAQVRDMLSGRTSVSTPEILAELEAIAPGALALLDSLGVGHAPSQTGGADGRIPVERAGELPEHTYGVPESAQAFLEDDDVFAALAAQLETDLQSDLATYVIEDVATLKSYYDALADLALQRGQYETALAWRDSIRAIEEKPALRLITGVMEAALVDARRAPDERFLDEFRASFRERLAALPYERVQTELGGMRAGIELATPNSLLGWVQSVLDRAGGDRRLSREEAQMIIKVRTAADRILPLRDVLLDVLGDAAAAHATGKPDIWGEREVSLQGRDDLVPVTIGIWDSGVDTGLFAERLFVNPGEVPDNGRDDDGNGYIDDVHGIAFDLDHERTTGVLAPLDLEPQALAEYRRYLKGRSDVTAGIDSPEAQAYRQKVASMAPSEFRPWLDGMSLFADFAHGTHVAGIAVQDNPAARLLVARNSEDNFKAVPKLATWERTRKHAQELRDIVDYMKRSGVRVATMSWMFSPNYFEDILTANDAGGSMEERRRLARQMFDTAAAALRSAMESAPEILFVAAAGNWDNDNRFVEYVPASFDLPNLITTGAVDRAGDETMFTSYGKVDVYANGHDVPSVVPGGVVVPMSGTSMATPQVTNLAAKLLALRPELTTAELREAILQAADERTIGGDRLVRLLSPKASLERVVR